MREYCRQVLRDATSTATDRVFACQRLGVMRREASPAGGELVGALADESPIVAGSARAALDAMGSSAIPWLMDGLTSKKEAVLLTCTWMLAHMGHRPAIADSIEDLIKLTRHESRGTRLAAVYILEQVGRDRTKVVNALIECLSNDDTDVRSAAATALVDLRFANGLVRQRIFEHLKEATEKRRITTAPLFAMAAAETDAELRAQIRASYMELVYARAAAGAAADMPKPEADKGEPIVFTDQLWLMPANARTLKESLALARLAPPAPTMEQFADAAEREKAQHQADLARVMGAAAEEYARYLSRDEYARNFAGGVRWLHAAPARAPSAAARWLAMAAKDYVWVINESAELLRRSIASLEEGSSSDRLAAMATITRMGAAARTAAIPAAERLLRDGNTRVRRAACELIGDESSRRVADQGDAIERLASEDPERRVGAVDVLASSAIWNEPTQQAARIVLHEGAPLVRAPVVEAIGRAWFGQTTVSEELAKLAAAPGLGNVERVATAAAVRAMKAGRADEQTLAPEMNQLKEALRKDSRSPRVAVVRRSIELARQTFGDARLLKEAVELAALSSHRELRYEATEALLELGADGVSGLVEMLKQKDPDARGLALVQLTRMAPESGSALPEIARLQKDEDPGVRELAERAVWTLRGQVRLPQWSPEERLRILAMLRDPSRQNRLAAATSILSQKVLPEAIARVIVKVVEDGDFAAREGLLKGLEEAWRQDRPLEVVLEESAGSSQAETRAYARAAQRALERTKGK